MPPCSSFLVFFLWPAAAAAASPSTSDVHSMMCKRARDFLVVSLLLLVNTRFEIKANTNDFTLPLVLENWLGKRRHLPKQLLAKRYDRLLASFVRTFSNERAG